MNPLPEDAGLLIVGHGTRDRDGAAQFQSLVELVRPRFPGTPIEPSFLEFAVPDIGQGLDKLARHGVDEVLVLPLLLFAAGHVRHDIPAAVATAAARHPALRVRQLGHLGCHPRIVQLSGQRYREATAGRTPVAADETCLLLVGRGSRDARATAEMHAFAQRRREGMAAVRVQTCFAAMQRPSLSEALPQVSMLDVRRIVVQPHLLFSGYLTRMIQTTVSATAGHRPGIEWIVTEPLGPDPLLAEAVAQIVSGWQPDLRDANQSDSNCVT